MKKIIVLLMLLLTMCSSVLAKAEQPSKMTEEEQKLDAKTIATILDSNLDLKRWVLVTISTNDDYFFIDKETVVAPYSDRLEYWLCQFRPGGKGSCGAPWCKEKKMDTAKHYHYIRYSCDLRHLKQKITSGSTRDESMKLIESVDIPSYVQKENDIFPGSLGEMAMLKAKEIASQKKKK